MPVTTIFLDDGDVMNDNRVRGPQWQRLLGEYFPSRLGGTGDAWATANGVVMESELGGEVFAAMIAAAPDYHTFARTFDLEWMARMCRLVGVPIPPDEEAIEFARASSDYVTPRVRSAFPGVVKAIRSLRAAGYALNTASGELSVELAGYLTGMGVRDCFHRLYGPDLVNIAKCGPLYYERIFADAGVAPETALVVDDKPEVLGWASAVGARTVLVGEGEGSFSLVPTVRSLAELPEWLLVNATPD